MIFMKSAVSRAIVLTAALAMATFASSASGAEPTYEAQFTNDDKLIRPAGWREWVFIGSPVTPNSLNGGEAAFPEFHSVYLDPTSWAEWKKTGTFREGTMIAKELSSVGATAATSGIGFFNGN